MRAATDSTVTSGTYMIDLPMLTSLVDPTGMIARWAWSLFGYGRLRRHAACQHLGRVCGQHPELVSFPPARAHRLHANQRSHQFIRHRQAMLSSLALPPTPRRHAQSAATQHPFPPTSFRRDQSERLAMWASDQRPVVSADGNGLVTLGLIKSGLGTMRPSSRLGSTADRGGSDQWTSVMRFSGDQMFNCLMSWVTQPPGRSSLLSRLSTRLWARMETTNNKLWNFDQNGAVFQKPGDRHGLYSLQHIRSR